MADIEIETDVVAYTLRLTPEEFDWLRDVVWYDVTIGDADKCGIRPALIDMYGANFASNVRGRSLR